MNYKEYQEQNGSVSWKDYVDLRFKEQDRALSLAHGELDRRLEGMNEMRSQLDRQAGTFVTRDAFLTTAGVITDRMTSLEKTSAANEARARVYAVIMSSFISTLVGLVVYFLAKR